MHRIWGISECHPVDCSAEGQTWLLVPPRLSPDPAAGFKHGQWRKGGDTAFQASTLVSGFVTTVGGCHGAEEMLGAALQVQGAPGTVLVPELSLGAQEDPHIPAPTQSHLQLPLQPIPSRRESSVNICADLELTARSVLAEHRAGEMQSSHIIKQTNQESCTCFPCILLCSSAEI